MKPKSKTMSLFFAICLHLQLKSDTHDIIPWGRLKIFDFFSGEGSEIFNSLTIELNRYDHTNNDDNEDSDEEFTLKDVVGKENEQAVGSILGAASSADDDEDDEVIKSDEKCHVKG